MAAQGARSESLNPFELAIKIRVVAEANAKADFQTRLSVSINS